MRTHFSFVRLVMSLFLAGFLWAPVQAQNNNSDLCKTLQAEPEAFEAMIEAMLAVNANPWADMGVYSATNNGFTADFFGSAGVPVPLNQASAWKKQFARLLEIVQNDAPLQRLIRNVEAAEKKALAAAREKTANPGNASAKAAAEAADKELAQAHEAFEKHPLYLLAIYLEGKWDLFQQIHREIINRDGAAGYLARIESIRQTLRSAARGLSRTLGCDGSLVPDPPGAKPERPLVRLPGRKRPNPIAPFHVLAPVHQSPFVLVFDEQNLRPFNPFGSASSSSKPFVPPDGPVPPGAPPTWNLVGLNPQPEPPSQPNDVVGLNPQPEPPGFWSLVAQVAATPQEQMQPLLKPFNQWATQSDPRLFRNVEHQVVSIGAVLHQMSAQGKISGEESWVNLAQQGLNAAVSGELVGEGYSSQVNVEANSLRRGMLMQQLSRLQRSDAISLDDLSQKSPPSQAGSQTAKVTAKNSKGAPVPGVTFTFLVQTPSPDGPTTETTTAQTNDQGQIEIDRTDQPITAQPAPGKVSLPLETTVVGLIPSGEAAEDFYPMVSLPQQPQGDGTVVEVEERARFQVTLALSKPTEPDSLKQNVQQAIAELFGALEKGGHALPEGVSPPDGSLNSMPSLGATDQLASVDPFWQIAVSSGATDDSPSSQSQSQSQSQSSPSPSTSTDLVAFVTVPVPAIPDRNGRPLTRESLNAAVNSLQQSGLTLFTEVAVPRSAEALSPSDPYFTSRGSWGQRYADQWGLHAIGLMPQQGDETTLDSGWLPMMDANRYVLSPATVAVIGSGVDYTHADLMTRMWVNTREFLNGQDSDNNGFADDVFGWNFRDDSADVMDYGGHDTHVAGVIAAEWNGYGMVGINPSARIMALKVADMFGQTDSAAISRAVIYAVDHGARVINISYTGEQPSQFEQAAILYAQQHGVLIVAAAGNQADNTSARSIANYPGVMTVASTGVEGERAGFSNWGQHVDISAPGMEILSLRARNTDFLRSIGDNDDYKTGSAVVGKNRDLYRAGGTSFSAPMVAGVASLLWSIDPGLTAQEVRRLLLMSADDLDVPGWDQNTGAGLLNAKRALQSVREDFIVARITQVAPGPVEKNVPTVEVQGVAVAQGDFTVQVQFAFGATPKDAEWQTFIENKVAVTGVAARIPATKFNRRGVWSIRLVVTDAGGQIRESRAELNLQ